MTATPRITAAAVREAATRLLGTIVLDLADMTTTPARYVPRMQAFAAIDGEEVIGDDDGSLIVLVQPGSIGDLLDQHGTPGAVAAVLTRDLRAVWSA
jgi:hypothetical protein